MMEQWQLLKARFDQLETRQQYLAMLGTVVIIAFLFMTLIYRPLNSSLTAEKAAYFSQMELRDWMQAQVTQLKSQSGNSPNTSNRGNRSASVLINEAATKNTIQISRSQPRSNNQYQIWLDKVTFTQLMTWLTELQTDFGIHVHTINISKAEDAGLVRVNLTFQDGV